MNISWLLAAIHLVAVGAAFAGVWSRARALDQGPGQVNLKEVFVADGIWGVTAVVLITTGLTRAFGGFEKGSAYYEHQPFFHIKMACLVLILLLEVYPMIMLIRWRIAPKSGATPNLNLASRLARISYLQALILAFMVMAATAMARGLTL